MAATFLPGVQSHHRHRGHRLGRLVQPRSTTRSGLRLGNSFEMGLTSGFLGTVAIVVAVIFAIFSLIILVSFNKVLRSSVEV